MKSSYIVAIGITVVSVLWLASGQFGSSGEETTAGTAEAAAPEQDLFAVRVAEMTAVPMLREVSVTGQSAPNRTVDLRAEIRGQVQEVLATKGAPITEGTPIVRIAVDARRADLEEAKANLELRRIEYEAAKSLAERGFNTEIRRAETKARFEAAQAQLRQAELALAKTEVLAPFDGVLEERAVEVGDYVDTKDPIATVVDLDPIKFVAFVTERNITDLQTGNKASIRMLDGSEIEGQITYIAARAGDTGRTFRVEVEAPNPDRKVIAGLTTSLRLPVTTRLAHKVSPAVLTLDDAGIIGVNTLDAEDRVEFHPVTILGSGEDGVWLGGLPEKVRMVVVGQEFIVPGEKVRPVPVDGKLS